MKYNYKKLPCCGGYGVNNEEWCEGHIQKCMNRIECIGCGEKNAWPGMQGRNQDRCNKCTIPSPYRDIDFDPERSY